MRLQNVFHLSSNKENLACSYSSAAQCQLANIPDLGRKNAGIEKIYWLVPASMVVSRRMGIIYPPTTMRINKLKSTANLSLAKRSLTSLITLCRRVFSPTGRWQTRMRVIGFSRGCNFLTSYATISSVGQCIIL